MLLHSGTQCQLISETTLGPGTTAREGSIDSDSLLVTLYADTVTSGTLQVTVYTLTDVGKEAELIVFPAISAPTGQLLLRKSGVSLQRFRVVATFTGVCSYEVYVRAIQGAGESSVRTLGAAELSTSATSVTTTPGLLIPASLLDRNGMTIKNYGASTIFVSELASKLPSNAWPISPGEVWSLDVAAGVEIYAVSSSGTVDVRIAESGG